MRRNNWSVGVLLALIIRVCSVNAATIPWNNPSGNIPGVFSWTNGESDHGLYGSPTQTADGLVFFPNNFIAQSQNGAAAATTDRLSFTLTLEPGKQLDKFMVTEYGDYSISGSNPTGNTFLGSVSATGALFLTKLNGSSDIRSQSLITSPSMTPTPITANSPPGGGANVVSGQWQGDMDIINLPDGWTQVQVVLNNNLQTSTGADSSALIQKKVLNTNGAVEISVIIPEPATLALGMMGTSMLLLRRRNRSA